MQLTAAMIKLTWCYMY